MKIIKQGAEAIIYLKDNKIVKERIRKSYRLEELDKKLRRFRTKRESKLLNKAGINVPELYGFSDEDTRIDMEFIKGDLLRDIFDKINDKKRKEICELIGKQVRELHNRGIIHGDLTTSNMILRDNKIYFIDFGLGFFSNKVEDKAVDLYLLKQALKSKHYKNFKSGFEIILKSYEPNKEFMDRLEKVEKRGRYKRKLFKSKFF
jgi:TP53 regulating kinase-like protein